MSGWTVALLLVLYPFAFVIPFITRVLPRTFYRISCMLKAVVVYTAVESNDKVPAGWKRHSMSLCRVAVAQFSRTRDGHDGPADRRARPCDSHSGTAAVSQSTDLILLPLYQQRTVASQRYA